MATFATHLRIDFCIVGRLFFSHDLPSMSETFDAEKWIFVGDTEHCEYSKQQVQICKDLNLPLKGAILCNDENQRESEACQKVPAFPCFCNIETSVCISGLRETEDDFKELQRLSNDSSQNKK